MRKHRDQNDAPPHSHSPKRGRGWGPYLLGVGVLLAGCDRPQPPAAVAAREPEPVQVVHAHRGAITRFVTLPGEIKPYQEATLYAKVSGYLKTITVDKGDQVKEGTLLAEIEVPELIAERSRYKAEVEV